MMLGTRAIPAARFADLSGSSGRIPALGPNGTNLSKHPDSGRRATMLRGRHYAGCGHGSYETRRVPRSIRDVGVSDGHGSISTDSGHAHHRHRHRCRPTSSGVSTTTVSRHARPDRRCPRTARRGRCGAAGAGLGPFQSARARFSLRSAHRLVTAVSRERRRRRPLVLDCPPGLAISSQARCGLLSCLSRRPQARSLAP